MRLRKHEEREAAARLMLRKRQLAEADRKVSEAENELASCLDEAQARRAELKKSLSGEMIASQVAGRLSHIRSIEEKCGRVKARVAGLRRERGKVARELEQERKKLKDRFVDKRSAEKYLERLEKEAAREKEKRSEDEF